MYTRTQPTKKRSHPSGGRLGWGGVDWLGGGRWLLNIRDCPARRQTPRNASIFWICADGSGSQVHLYRTPPPPSRDGTICRLKHETFHHLWSARPGQQAAFFPRSQTDLCFFYLSREKHAKGSRPCWGQSLIMRQQTQLRAESKWGARGSSLQKQERTVDKQSFRAGRGERKKSIDSQLVESALSSVINASQ